MPCKQQSDILTVYQTQFFAKFTQANQKLTAFQNNYWTSIEPKGLNAMPALSIFLVLLALFLLASHVHAFTSLSSVAGDQVQVNHLIRLQQLMSKPMNETKAESESQELETEPKAKSKSREPETDPKAESESREPENDPKAESKSREPENEPKAESKSREPGNEPKAESKRREPETSKSQEPEINRKPRAKRQEPRGNAFRPKLIVEYSYIASSFQYFSSYNFRLVVEFILIPHSEGEFYSSKSEGAIASIRQLIVTLTFERSIEAFPIFQLIEVSVPDENNLCSVFQMVANGHNTFVESNFFNDDSFQLVVE